MRAFFNVQHSKFHTFTRLEKNVFQRSSLHFDLTFLDDQFHKMQHNKQSTFRPSIKTSLLVRLFKKFCHAMA